LSLARLDSVAGARHRRNACTIFVLAAYSPRPNVTTLVAHLAPLAIAPTRRAIYRPFGVGASSSLARLDSVASARHRRGACTIFFLAAYSLRIGAAPAPSAPLATASSFTHGHKLALRRSFSPLVGTVGSSRRRVVAHRRARHLRAACCCAELRHSITG
jgi:hypothetical protein